MNSPSQTLATHSYNDHSLCFADIETSILQAVLHGISPPLLRPTNRVRTSTLSYLDLLSNPVVFHPLHMAELSEMTFINLLIYTIRHPAQLPYTCIRDFIHSPDTQQTSEVVYLCNPNPRSLIRPSYYCLTTIRKNRHQE